MNMTESSNTQAPMNDDPMLGNDCQAGPCNRTPYIRHLWYAHAILMSISFIILIPSAIIASLLKKFLRVNIGYKIHLILNGTALVLILCGFSIAVYIVSTFTLLLCMLHNAKWSVFHDLTSLVSPIQKQVTRSLPHFSMSCNHRAIGLAIFLLLVVHSTLGYFRPAAVPQLRAQGDDCNEQTEYESEASNTSGDLASSKSEDSAESQPHKITLGDISNLHVECSLVHFEQSSPNNDDHLALESGECEPQKTTLSDSSSRPLEFPLPRFVWECCHRFFGLVILMLGWYNCVDGFSEYEADYDGETLLVNGPTIFLTLQGIIGAVILFLLSAKASKMKVF